MSEASSEEFLTDSDVQSWSQRFKDAIEINLKSTLDATNMANAALPTGLILGCGALGALIAGPVGFGVGSIAGNLLTGQIKPGAAAKMIEHDILQKD